ncbi:MAG: hypothetical protein EXR86_09170 [Gammaproteobacteria bacterium]|nr:hypothetical protein [Gammaproteobacteria bacterium]
MFKSEFARLVLLFTLALPAYAKDESTRVIDRLLAPPTIEPAAGFSAQVLVPPGRLYDPLSMLHHQGKVWVIDDGGEEQDKGSRLLEIDPTGKVSPIVGLGKILPTVGFDLAPPEFGKFGGQFFLLSQPEVAMPGAQANHLILRLDPKTNYTTTTHCTLPEAGEVRTAGYGLDAHFGPKGSPFEGRLFVVTIMNNAVYEATPDGQCKPFVVFDGKHYSAPMVNAFAADGKSMLVSVSTEPYNFASKPPLNGAILRILPDGSVDPKPVYVGATRPTGFDYAPTGFGEFGGQLFFADMGAIQIPVPMTQTVNADAAIYRVDNAGKAQLVARGFHNPLAIRFIGDELWVTDINGDFIAGKRELPDGFVVRIKVN